MGNKILRSKNAGPLQLTFDIIFDGQDVYERVIKSKTLTKKLVSELYHVAEENISIINYPAANSIKITIPRRIISGDIGDTDVYGAQQHAPFFNVEID